MHKHSPLFKKALLEIFVGLQQLYRKPLSSFLAIFTLSVALFGLVAAYTLYINLDSLASRWSESSRINIYLKKGISSEIAMSLTQKLRSNTLVVSSQLITPDEGVKLLVTNVNAKLSKHLADIKPNPLPYTIIIYPRVEKMPSDIALGFIEELKKNPEVESISSDVNWVSYGYDVLRFCKNGAVVWMLVFSINALFVLGGVGGLIAHISMSKSDLTRNVTRSRLGWYGFLSAIVALLAIRFLVGTLETLSIVVVFPGPWFSTVFVLVSAIICIMGSGFYTDQKR